MILTFLVILFLSAFIRKEKKENNFASNCFPKNFSKNFYPSKVIFDTTWQLHNKL